jgi:hypothetical protein
LDRDELGLGINIHSKGKVNMYNSLYLKEWIKIYHHKNI